MSDGETPTRVIMLGDERYHCTDVRDRRRVIDGSRWGDSWCFCGAVSHNALSNVSTSHCHLLDKLYCQHVSDDERLNGKTNYRQAPCDNTVRLSTVSCSYQIPSSVECLDLAVNSLQRISGNYFVTRQLPCMLSVCRCHKSARNELAASNQTADFSLTDGRNKSTRKHRESDRLTVAAACTSNQTADLSVTDSGNKNPRKCRESDRLTVAAACELEALYGDSDMSDYNLKLRRRRQRQSSHCTRSSSRHLIDSSTVDRVSVRGASHPADIQSVSCNVAPSGPDNGDMSVSRRRERSVESAASVSESHSHMTSVNELHGHVTSARKTRSTTAAAGETMKSTRCAVDRLREQPRRIVRTRIRRSVTRCRKRLQRVIASKRQNELNTTQRKLRSSQLSVSAVQTDTEPLQLSGGHVNTTLGHGHCTDTSTQRATRADIAADCEVVVPRLPAPSTHRRKNGLIRGRRLRAAAPLSVSGATRRLRCTRNTEMTSLPAAEYTNNKPPKINCVALQHETTGLSCNSKPPKINRVASERESTGITCNSKPAKINHIASEHETTSDSDSKTCSLSVDVSFDHDDAGCSSPASPLPVNLTSAKSEHCNNVLQTAAGLLTARSALC